MSDKNLIDTTLRDLDAAFIVKAVNSFEKNEKELEFLRNCHEELVRTLKLVQSGRHCMADINEAIAKAESQEGK